MNTPYYGIAVLALIILMPFLTVAVGDPGIGNHGFPIVFDNAAQARTPHNTGGSAVAPTVTAGPNNQTIVVITGAVRCAVTCGTTVPHITTVTDAVGTTYTDQIDVFNAGNSSDAGHYSLWTGPVPTTTLIGTLDAISVRWNQTTVGYAVAGVYDNVKGIGTVQSISGNSYLANQTITTQFSGSIIVGGSTVMNSSLTNPNVATLTERNPVFNSNCLKIIPPNVFPCVGVDLSDTSPTQYINAYPFFFSQKMNPTGPAKHYPFVQGVIELTSLLTEPNDQTGECTQTNAISSTGCDPCLNPPPNNPNACHIFNWNPFPTNIGVTPTTGLFNNDTSYIFPMNMTGILAFTMCANVRSDTGTNDTLVLQYFTPTLTWVNLDTGIDAGSIPLSGSVYPIIICSLQLGYVPSTITSLCANWPNGGTGCSLRISGNGGAVVNGAGPSTLSLSELFAQFYFNSFTARNTIICSATSRTTTQFTNQCSRVIATVADSLTVAWEANNLGLTFQSGSVTCSFGAGTNTCTNVITFSPAFATAPSVLLDQSKTIGVGTITGGNSQVISVLN